MSKRLDGRVVIVTGAGRGIGREYALLAARSGAKVVVNDLGTSLDGTSDGTTPADALVEEIRAFGGTAVANRNDVATWDGAEALVKQAIEEFGDLHVLINNAGIMRDRMLVNMTLEEWDAVIGMNLRSHFCTARHAAAYWREQSKAGVQADRVVINTSSVSGLHGNVGQANYGTAKAGIASFTGLLDRELERYHVRSYAIAPGARTRLTLSTPNAAKTVGLEVPEGVWDEKSPANVAPFVLWLAAEGCPMPSGNVFGVAGGRVDLYHSWRKAVTITNDHTWSFEELDEAAPVLISQVVERIATVSETALKRAAAESAQAGSR